MVVLEAIRGRVDESRQENVASCDEKPRY